MRTCDLCAHCGMCPLTWLWLCQRSCTGQSSSISLSLPARALMLSAPVLTGYRTCVDDDACVAHADELRWSANSISRHIPVYVYVHMYAYGLIMYVCQYECIIISKHHTISESFYSDQGMTDRFTYKNEPILSFIRTFFVRAVVMSLSSCSWLFLNRTISLFRMMHFLHFRFSTMRPCGLRVYMHAYTNTSFVACYTCTYE